MRKDGVVEVVKVATSQALSYVSPAAWSQDHPHLHKDSTLCFFAPSTCRIQKEASLICPDVCCRSTIAIVMSPVGPYFPTGLKPISLFIDEHNVRAWPGGVGNNKVGTNYAPTIGPQSDAADTYGTSQVLYSFPQGSQPDDALVSECGAMNLMFFLQKVHALDFVLVWTQALALDVSMHLTTSDDCLIGSAPLFTVFNMKTEPCV